MANTYVKIGSTVTVGAGGASSITFSSIPSTYTDLVVMLSIRSDQANNANTLNVNFNGSSVNQSIRGIEASGSSAYTYTLSNGVGNAQGTSSTSNTFSSIRMYIPDYTSSNYKSFSSDGATENNGNPAYFTLFAGLWSSTAAITSLSFTFTNLVQYSTASLYGIKNS
jgi:hypothetical protein